MRRWAACLLILASVSLIPRPARAQPAGPPPLAAKAYLLMDAATGEVLHAHQPDERLPIASITKIMTAILALERGDLTARSTASRRAAAIGGTTMYLEEGEEHTLQDLLYATMILSANDASVMIAEQLAGSEAGFVQWMNEKARELGATNTNFTNPMGFDGGGRHYSTARDMAVIARYAMQNPGFRALVAAKEWSIPANRVAGARRLTTRNPLLHNLEGGIGIKNGWTPRALSTYVAAARRADRELIAVVLGTEDGAWNLPRILLEYGFATFRPHTAVRKGQVLAELPVVGAQPVRAIAAHDLIINLRLGEPEPIPVITLEPLLPSPLPVGAVLGRVELPGRGAVDLIAAEERRPERPSVWSPIMETPAPVAAAPRQTPPTRIDSLEKGSTGLPVLAWAVLLLLREVRRRRRPAGQFIKNFTQKIIQEQSRNKGSKDLS